MWIANLKMVANNFVLENICENSANFQIHKTLTLVDWGCHIKAHDALTRTSTICQYIYETLYQHADIVKNVSETVS